MEKSEVNHDEKELGPSGQTSIEVFDVTDQDSEKLTHGDKCALVIKSLCPNATVICVDNLNYKEDLSPGFYDCASYDDPAIDITSYSFSSPHFDLNLCQAVSEATIGGKIVVFAAGNAGQRFCNTIGYPGRIGNILVIGGRDPYHNHVKFSLTLRSMIGGLYPYYRHLIMYTQSVTS